MNKHKIIDLIQWFLIIILFGVCVYTNKKNNRFEIESQNIYTKIYDSQKIESLKSENKMLYDSIKHLNDIESVIEIQYKYIYKTDTIFVNTFDTLKKDSVYHFSSNNDTVSYKLDIFANQIYWYKFNFDLNNNFTIVTRENENKIQTDIKTNIGYIDKTIMWHRKNKTFKERFVIGPQVGGGYDFLNRKPTLYVGFGATYDLW